MGYESVELGVRSAVYGVIRHVLYYIRIIGYDNVLANFNSSLLIPHSTLLTETVFGAKQ